MMDVLRLDQDQISIRLTEAELRDLLRTLGWAEMTYGDVERELFNGAERLGVEP